MFTNDQMKQVVSAAIIGALEDQAQPLLKEIVEKILTEKVDPDTARPGRYSSDNKATFLEAIVQRHLRSTVVGAIEQWMESHKAEVSQAVQKAMQSDDIGNQMANHLALILREGFMRVNVTFARDD